MTSGRERNQGPPDGDSVAELRDWQAGALRDVMGYSGLIVPEDTRLDPSVERDNRFDNDYGRLAERLYSAVAAQARTTGDKDRIELATQPNVLNGCYVLTRLMSYGPGAYANYLRANPKHEGSLEELGEIMKRSGDTVRMFADTGKRVNSTYETNFGLRQYEPPYERTPFTIEPDDDGELVFVPAQTTLFPTQAEITARQLEGDLPEDPDQAERCPAIGRVLSTVWRAGVDEAVRDPGLFQAGFDEAMQEIRMQLVKVEEGKLLLDIEPPLDEKKEALLREDIILRDIPEEALVLRKRTPDVGSPFTEINLKEVGEGVDRVGLEFDEVNFAGRIAGVLQASGDTVRFDKRVRPIEQRGYRFLSTSTISPAD